VHHGGDQFIQRLQRREACPIRLLERGNFRLRDRRIALEPAGLAGLAGLIEGWRARQLLIIEHPCMPGRGRGRAMRSARADIEEERAGLPGRPLDEIGSLLREDVGLIGAIAPPVASARAVLVQLEPDVPTLGGASPLVPTRRDVIGGGAVRVVVEVFPDQRRSVPGVLEPGRQGRNFVALLAESPEAAEVPVATKHAMILGILPPQQRGPGRGATRGGGQALLKARALRNQARRNRRHGPQFIGAQIIRHNEDDVWPGRALRPGWRNLAGERRTSDTSQELAPGEQRWLPRPPLQYACPHGDPFGKPRRARSRGSFPR
jgi:hypothetical protein